MNRVREGRNPATSGSYRGTSGRGGVILSSVLRFTGVSYGPQTSLR